MFECYEFEACEYNAQPKCCLPDGVECPHGVASHEPSDIEKLIEQLKEKDGLWCSIQTGEALIANTITALSTIQAENEELKEKLYDGEGVNLVNYWMQQAKIEENGHRNCQAALERAREEITRLKHYEDKCHDCPIVCAKTEIIKAHEELEAVQAELEQVQRERDAAVDCINQIQSARDHTRPAYVVDKILSDWRGPKEV